MLRRYRSAVSGRFVTLAYALRHPRTTVAEAIDRAVCRWANDTSEDEQ